LQFSIVDERLSIIIIGEETCEETENSSNDEDIDPTVDVNKKKLKGKTSLQHNSFSSIFTKLPGRLSKTNSIDTNNSNTAIEDIQPYRPSKKRRIWRKAFAQRRKTFTGFIKEGEEEVTMLPKSRPRPKSMLLPDRHLENAPYMKLARTISFNGTVGVGSGDNEYSTHNTPKSSRNNTFSSSSVTTVIEHKPESTTAVEQFGTRLSIRRCPPKQLPPDIVIDIERPIPEERFSMRSIQEVERCPGGSSSRPESRTSSSKANGGNLQLQQLQPHQHHHRKKKKKDAKTKDTWSKYLGVNAKRHEVYCALNSVKKRLRGSGRGVRGALKKSESVHLQRKASTLILDEKRDSMK